jgi:predicted outer membrane repeat protein
MTYNSSSKKRRNHLSCLTAILLLFNTNAQIFVDIDATGNNDGTSWANAYTSLQSAMDASDPYGSSDTIWVAEGVYLPSEIVGNAPAGDSRYRAFHSINKHLFIYGGFNGTETSIDQRNVQNHTTILSGDFNGDDLVTGIGATLSISNNGENAYKVLVLVTTNRFTLDGVTVRGGSPCSIPGEYIFGGFGISNSKGGGIYVESGNANLSEIKIVNSNIIENATIGNGAGIYVSYLKNLEISNSTLSHNISSSSGGAIYCDHTALKVNNSQIFGNSASSYGGIYGIRNPFFLNNTLEIIESAIEGNNGGGVFGETYDQIIVHNSNFSQNSSTTNGGGIVLCKLNTIKNSKFIGNSSTGYGGGLFFDGTSPNTLSMDSCELIGNNAVHGGGMYARFLNVNPFPPSTNTVNLNHCTLSGNSADSLGGGFAIFPKANFPGTFAHLQFNITGCTFTNNSARTGGGFYSSASASNTLNITNSTISENTALISGSGLYSSAINQSTLNLKGSILWNSSSSNYVIHSQYASGNPSFIAFNSLGYNIFSNSPNTAHSTDSVNVTALSLNLLPLDYNGGNTQTRLPGPGSIAWDSGDPSDMSDAQNKAIEGVRERGAAEYFCETTVNDIETACHSFTWRDGVTYNSDTTGVEYKVYSNIAGVCDSTYTLDLTINQPSSGIDVQTACISFQWIDGNTYTSSNNTATYTYFGGNVSGCDSTITLNLNILPIATGTDVQTVCSSFTWIDGNTYTSNNNTATYTLVGGAANGCDSIVSLNLTIDTVPDVTTTTSGIIISATQSGANYQWIDCNNGFAPIAGETYQNFVPIENGSYAVMVENGVCMASSECIIISTFNSAGQDEISAVEVINLFPNPSNGIVHIESTKALKSIKLYDLNGQLLIDEHTDFFHLNLMNLSKGIYFANFLMDNGSTITKRIEKL